MPTLKPTVVASIPNGLDGNRSFEVLESHAVELVVKWDYERHALVQGEVFDATRHYPMYNFGAASDFFKVLTQEDVELADSVELIISESLSSEPLASMSWSRKGLLEKALDAKKKAWMESDDNCLARLARVSSSDKSELVVAFGQAREMQMGSHNIRELMSVLDAWPTYEWSQETFWEEALEEWLELQGVDLDLLY